MIHMGKEVLPREIKHILAEKISVIEPKTWLSSKGQRLVCPVFAETLFEFVIFFPFFLFDFGC
jgi:hypothetical protein